MNAWENRQHQNKHTQLWAWISAFETEIPCATSVGGDIDFNLAAGFKTTAIYPGSHDLGTNEGVVTT